MGRKNQQGGNYQVRVNQDGSRRTFSQHDDRGGSDTYHHREHPPPHHINPEISSHNRVWRKDSKHVSFSSDRGGGIKKKYGRGGRGAVQGGVASRALRNVIIEDDEFGAPAPARGARGRGRGRGRGGQAGRSRPHVQGPGGRKPRRGGGVYINSSIVRRTGGTAPPAAGWFKVTVSHGAKYDKMDLLKTMLDNCTQKFAPIAFNKLGPHVQFYVQSRQMSEAISAMNQKVILSDSFKLSVRSESSPPPPTLMDDEAKEKMKLVLSSRYTPATKALDLKNFHADPQFLGQPMYVPLNRSNVFLEIVRIVGENIPEVEAVDLSENGLRSFDHVALMTDRTPNVKLLYLAKNRMTNVKDLIKFRGWKQLIELKLSDNPFIETLSDYQGAVRKVFPSLQILDGQPLPKMIRFDDDEDEGVKLPPPVMKQSCNPEAEPIVLQFLQQYISVYDSDSRESLMEAYHNDAVMSLCAAYPSGYTATGQNKLTAYQSESRNLYRVDRADRRTKLLRSGKLAIVSFLNDLPKSEHDLNSFTLDIPFATERLMTFTVSGVFREKADRRPIRAFNRMFVVVPQGSGFVIVNEMLFVTVPTHLQVKAAFTGTSPVAAAAVTAPTVPTSPAAPVDVNTMQQRMAQLSAKTNMNDNWSKICLEQTNWDLEKAYVAFQMAQSEGKIPAEAFVR